MSLPFWISPLGPHKTECVIYYLVTKARNLAGRALRRRRTSSLSLSLSLSFCFFIFLFCARRDATRGQTRPDERASKSKCCGQSVLPSVHHRFFRCRFSLIYRKQVDRLMKLCFACVRSAGVNRAVLFLRASFFSFLLLLLLLFLHLILLILQVAEEVAIPKFLRILSFSSCSR
jgi:hypothetical protein